MTELELYHADYSTCSQKVRIVLAEKAVPFISHGMSFADEEQLSPSYLKLNPNGVVPTLVHNGDNIIDSSCIVEYLDEVFPQPALSPNTALDRAEMRVWLRYMEEVPTTAIRMPSFEQVFLPMIRSVASAEAFEASRQRRTLRKGFYAKMNGGQGFADADKRNAISQLRDTTLKLEQSLTDSEWVLGELFSLVEATLAPLIDRAEDLGMVYLWQDLPHVCRWWQALKARPSVQAAFYPQSRLSERPEFHDIVLAVRAQNSVLNIDQVLAD